MTILELDNLIDYQRGCTSGECVSPAQRSPFNPGLSLIQDDGRNTNLITAGAVSRATALRFRMLHTRAILAPCNILAPERYAWVWYTGRTGNAIATVANGPSFAFSGNTNSRITINIEFEDTVDIDLQPRSFNGGAGVLERLFVGTPWNEFYPGTGSLLARSNNVATGTQYSDGNNGSGSVAVIRNVSSVNYTVTPGTRLTCTVSHRVVYGSFAYEARPCRHPTFVDGICGAGTTLVSSRRCATNAAAPNWFSAFPPHGGVWQYSANNGVTWAAAPNVTNHVAGIPAERLRYRQQFTIPNGFTGHWRVWVEGDKFDGGASTNSFGRFYMDGIQIDGDTELSNLRHWSPYIAVAPGVHILEWREGAYPAVGATAPLFGADYSKVRGESVPLNFISCVDQTGAVINSQYEVPPPPGYTISNTDCE